MSIVATLEALIEPAVEEPIVVPEDKLRKAYELKTKGVPVVNIAKSFGISEATAYRWLNKYEEQFSKEFTRRPRSDILLDMLRFVRVVRDSAMQEVFQIELAAKSVDRDGTVKRDQTLVDVKGMTGLLKTALDAENTAFRMLRDTGVLPNTSKEIHISLQDTRPPESLGVDTTIVSREEILSKITALITTGRTIPECVERVEEELINTDER